MKTVTICGSMKFETEMQRIAFLLETKHNMNVLQCVYNVDNLDITPMEQVALENAHYSKIELSDAIYVVDIQGYIGNQVSKEIDFLFIKWTRRRARNYRKSSRISVIISYQIGEVL